MAGTGGLVHPREAIGAHAAGRLTGEGLARALVGWDAWRLPAVLGPGGPRARLTPSDDGPWLAICCDAEAYAALEQGLGGSLDLHLEVRGAGLFAGLGEDLAGVDVDPFSEHALHYRRPQIPWLREIARAVEVERVVAGQEVSDAFKKVLAFDGYRVVVRATDEGGSQWVLAPDDRERLLLPVFTSEETVTAFVQSELVPRGVVPVIVRLDGRALYKRITEMVLHGIVFNPQGPLPARALSAQFAQVVLDAG